MTDRITDQQLDEIDARAVALNALGLPGGTWTASPRDEKSVFPPEMAHVVEDVLCTKTAKLRSSVGVFGDQAHAEFAAHAREDVRLLLAEVRRLRARVTELEGPAVEARAALAALCYDLEDPGSNALGALYLLSQATVGVDAPKDDAALALGQHAAQVLHKVADMADPEPPEVSFFGGMVGPAVAAWLRMLADRKTTVAALAEGAQR